MLSAQLQPSSSWSIFFFVPPQLYTPRSDGGLSTTRWEFGWRHDVGFGRQHLVPLAPVRRVIQEWALIICNVWYWSFNIAMV